MQRDLANSLCRVSRWWLGCIVLVLVSLSPIVGQEKLETYKKHWSLAQEAIASENLAEALSNLREVASVFPFESSCHFEMARCYAKLGRPEEALRSLESSIQFGWCDVDRINQSPEFKSLEKFDAFANLVSAAEECREEDVLLYAGGGVDKQNPSSLIIVLHGLGCGPRAEMPYWRTVADKLECVVVAPRAPTQLSSLLFGWQFAKARDSNSLDFYDMKSAQLTIDRALEQANEQYNIDPNQIVLAGFSQGAGVAIRVFGAQPDRYRGFIGIGGLYTPLDSPFWQRVANLQRRAVIMAGAHDPLLSRSEQLVANLEQAGIKLQFSADEETGHEYPTEHTARLNEALKFILEQ